MANQGQFEVPATSENGTDFTNPQSSQQVITFSALGTWVPDIRNDSLKTCTAEGIASLTPKVQTALKTGWPDLQKYMKYPNNTPFALVAQNTKTGAVTDIGKKATVVLQPGETLRFVLNDVSWGYGDNSGGIKVEWSSVKLVSKVLQFDGDGDYIALPAINVNLAAGLTIEAWACFDAFQSFSRIIDFGNGVALDNILLCHETTSNNLRMDVYKGGTATKLVAPGVLEQGKWTHLAATLDPGGNAILYKNGQQVAAAKLNFPVNINRTLNYIGKSNWNYDKDFKGKMAEVRFWNRVRTAAEIQADMSKRLSGKEAGLVGLWPLSEVRTEGSALKVADLTGNFSGTVNGAVPVEDSTFPLR